MATQTERRQATQGALLDAAVESLIDVGLAGFTTSDVAKRAQLSNGALFRHFPTKNELLAATVEHVFDRLRADYEGEFEALPEDKRTIANLLEILWRVMADPALAAVFELYTASRTDVWMRNALEPIVAEHMRRLHDLGGQVIDQLPNHHGVDPRQAIDLAILSMQGLVVNLMARPDPDSPQQLIEGLTLLAEVLLPGAASEPTSHTPRRSSPARTRNRTTKRGA